MAIEITKLSSKGQVVIPQDIRKERKIKEGEKFIVYDVGDTIVLKRIKNIEAAKNMEEFEKTFESMWETAKKRKVTKEDIEAEIKAYREENA